MNTNRIQGTVGDRLMLARRAKRAGVTLMEVIFAIGIILSGLVGLAALIPIAANNAQSTLELDRSISESTSAAAIGEAQLFNDLESLVIFDKPAAESTAIAVLNTFVYAPSNAMRTIDWKINGQRNIDFPINATPPPILTLGKLETPGYGHHGLNTGLTAGICIDPLGMPDINLASPFTAVSNADSAFDYSRFPYYGERYRVLAEPNAAIGNSSAPAGATPVWPMSPRMWRATLKSPLYTTGTAIQRHQLMSAASIRNVFRGSGGVSGFASADVTKPQSILMSQSMIGGSYVDAAADTSGDYTWFATLAPPFLGGNTFRQSIVVVRNRLPQVPTRANDPLALQKNNYTVKDSDDNPQGERMAWVGDAIGFQGGAGGEVLLYGSQSVSDLIRSGQWVMLSRQPHRRGPPGPPLQVTGPAVHRWYRVLRVNDSETIDNYNWVGGTHNVWRRWVTLAGPDWTFQDETTLPFTTPIDDTFCTIITGAVSVIESEVVIQQ